MKVVGTGPAVAPPTGREGGRLGREETGKWRGGHGGRDRRRLPRVQSFGETILRRGGDNVDRLDSGWDMSKYCITRPKLFDRK